MGVSPDGRTCGAAYMADSSSSHLVEVSQRAMVALWAAIATSAKVRSAAPDGPDGEPQEKTSGGLKKENLTQSKTGKVVSKKASAAAKARYAKSRVKAWAEAVQAARKALGITGFVAIGGKSASGKALYAKAKSIYGA